MLISDIIASGHIYYSANGEELIIFSHKIGRGVNSQQQNGIKFSILTGEIS